MALHLPGWDRLLRKYVNWGIFIPILYWFLNRGGSDAKREAVCTFGGIDFNDAGHRIIINPTNKRIKYHESSNVKRTGEGGNSDQRLGHPAA
ncbi:MAG: hypothetical protein H6Q04_2275 [Acidobacteria bacterium]|nr:hypothetical protein [Acidobacteriota bacterium]